jgi:AraC-like DNA-binding protein
MMWQRNKAHLDRRIVLPGERTVVLRSISPDVDRQIAVGVVRDDRDRRQISRELGDVASVVFADRSGCLCELLGRHHASVAVVEPLDRFGMPTAGTVAEAKRAFPSVVVIGYCDARSTRGYEIADLVRAGADELVVRGVDDLARVTRAAVARSHHRGSMTDVVAAMSQIVGSGLSPFISYCLSRSDEPVSVGGAANAVGVSRRTLANRAVAAGAPAPSVLLAWCRLCNAARMLEDPIRTIEQTALSLGFGSGSALRRMLKRYASIDARELQTPRGGDVIVSRFEDAVRLARNNQLNVARDEPKAEASALDISCP